MSKIEQVNVGEQFGEAVRKSPTSPNRPTAVSPMLGSITVPPGAFFGEITHGASASNQFKSFARIPIWPRASEVLQLPLRISKQVLEFTHGHAASDRVVSAQALRKTATVAAARRPESKSLDTPPGHGQNNDIT
jgi:hypothetical protein